MPDVNFGVDSGDKVDASFLTRVSGAMGGTPMFWGRTFAKDKGNFDPSENKILATNLIRVLPIAQQTVSGSAADGASDAKDNVAALLKAIPAAFMKQQGTRFFLFLACEGNLTKEYYQGWHKGVLSAGGGLIGPCVQVKADADDAIDVIRSLTDRPDALWVIRWQKADGNARKAPDGTWNPLGEPNRTKIPLVLWQYQNDKNKGFNCNWINPSIGPSELAQHLPLPLGSVLPPLPAVTTKPNAPAPTPTKPEPAKPTPAGPTKPEPTKPSGSGPTKPAQGKPQPSALDDVRKGKLMLKPGSKGDAVKELQQGLVDRGYKLDVDGAFGPGTAGVVKKFQKDQKLGADGIVGPATMKAFDAAAPKS